VTALALSVVAGRTPLVLVAPHGGRRDARLHPWGSRPLKMNDLHTASLTFELAERSGAAALVNEQLDRNLTDLNRIGAAHASAPAFLERLHALVATAHARHGFAVVVTIHGWNVVQPAVDLGLGCRPTGGTLGATAAVSPEFAGTAVTALRRELAERGIATTLGARYPAQARENLVQLFSGRHRDDARAPIGDCAALANTTEALQLELGAPLRWPGEWRRRFVDACVTALPALVSRATPPPGALAGLSCGAPPATPTSSRRLEVVGRGFDVAGAASDAFALVAALDATGGRLLVFPPDGTLLMFGADRLDAAASGDGDAVGGLALADGASPALRYRGPLLHFPHTAPFVDLEEGLASAAMIDDAELRLEIEPDTAPQPSEGRFGRIHGTLRVGARAHGLAGRAFLARSDAPLPWPRLRTALRLARGERLVVAVDTAAGSADGTLVRDGGRCGVRAATLRFDDPDHPLDRWQLEVALADGSRRRVELAAVHRLPVVRGGPERAIRVLYASCRIVGDAGVAPIGWAELAGY